VTDENPRVVLRVLQPGVSCAKIAKRER
jgi:hypothetical protein